MQILSRKKALKGNFYITAVSLSDSMFIQMC